MRLALAAALAAFLSAPAAHAEITDVAEMAGGDRIELHDHAGPCVRGALLATYLTKGGETVPGCWVDRGPHIAIVFFDGDVGAVPKAALKPAKKI